MAKLQNTVLCHLPHLLKLLLSQILTFKSFERTGFLRSLCAGISSLVKSKLSNNFFFSSSFVLFLAFPILHQAYHQGHPFIPSVFIFCEVHGITEWVRLEGSIVGYLVQPSCTNRLIPEHIAQDCVQRVFDCFQ